MKVSHLSASSLDQLACMPALDVLRDLAHAHSIATWAGLHLRRDLTSKRLSASVYLELMLLALRHH